MTRNCIISVLFTLLSVDAIGQDTTLATRAAGNWVNLGAGFNSLGSSLGVSMTFRNHWQIVTGRFNYVDELNYSLKFLKPEDEPTKSIWELSLLYGFGHTGAFTFTSIAAGVSFVAERDRGRILQTVSTGFLSAKRVHETIMISSIGLSLESQHYYRLSSSFGIGLTLFGIFARRNVVAGGMICLHVGRWH